MAIYFLSIPQQVIKALKEFLTEILLFGFSGPEGGGTLTGQ